MGVPARDFVYLHVNAVVAASGVGIIAVGTLVAWALTGRPVVLLLVLPLAPLLGVGFYAASLGLDVSRDGVRVRNFGSSVVRSWEEVSFGLGTAQRSLGPEREWLLMIDRSTGATVAVANCWRPRGFDEIDAEAEAEVSSAPVRAQIRWFVTLGTLVDELNTLAATSDGSFEPGVEPER